MQIPAPNSSNIIFWAIEDRGKEGGRVKDNIQILSDAIAQT